jgi:hypothetical protein
MVNRLTMQSFPMARSIPVMELTTGDIRTCGGGHMAHVDAGREAFA